MVPPVRFIVAQLCPGPVAGLKQPVSSPNVCDSSRLSAGSANETGLAAKPPAPPG